MQVPQVEGITVLDDQQDAAAAQASGADSDADSVASERDSDTAEQQHDLPTVRGQQIGRATSRATAVPARPHDEEQSELQQFENAQQRREELKQQLAVTASKVLQNPEAHLPSLKSVLTLAADKDAQVQLACLLTHSLMSETLHATHVACNSQPDVRHHDV